MNWRNVFVLAVLAATLVSAVGCCRTCGYNRRSCNRPCNRPCLLRPCGACASPCCDTCASPCDCSCGCH